LWVQEKGVYKLAFVQLRDLKAEIEGLQAMLEGSRQRLQRDFQQWLAATLAQQQRAAGAAAEGQPAAVVGAGLASASAGAGEGGGGRRGDDARREAQRLARPASGRPAGKLAAVGAGGGRAGGDLSTQDAAPKQHDPAVQQARGAAAGGSSISAVSDGMAPGLAGYDPAVVSAARPHLTGDARADQVSAMGRGAGRVARGTAGRAGRPLPPAGLRDWHMHGCPGCLTPAVGCAAGRAALLRGSGQTCAPEARMRCPAGTNARG
jgi:hypothetical protein